MYEHSLIDFQVFQKEFSMHQLQKFKVFFFFLALISPYLAIGGALEITELDSETYAFYEARLVEAEQNNAELYTKQLTRFQGKHKYDPSNSAALDEIDLIVTVASGMQDKNLPPPPGFQTAIPVIGREHRTHRKVVYGYIFQSTTLDMVVLSFTGTQTITQWISDLKFRQVPPEGINNTTPEMLVHKGFYQIYKSVQEFIQSTLPDLINKNTQFVISGHSLGGALTTLAGLDLVNFSPIVYTYAAPRVGNNAFAQGYNSYKPLSFTWRVFNTEDVVPYLPLPEFPLGIRRPPKQFYEHVGNPVAFTLNEEGLLKNHVEAYKVVIIDRQPPENPNGICPKKHDCTQVEPD